MKKKLLILLSLGLIGFLTPLISYGATSTMIFGTTTIGTEENAGHDYFHCGKYTSTFAGICNVIKIYSGVAGNLKYAVYSDNGGTLGSLLYGVNTASADTENAWSTYEVASGSEMTIANGTPYWICAHGSIVGTIVYQSGSNVGNQKYKAITYETYNWENPPGGLSSGDSGLSYQCWDIEEDGAPPAGGSGTMGFPELLMIILATFCLCFIIDKGGDKIIKGVDKAYEYRLYG